MKQTNLVQADQILDVINNKASVRLGHSQEDSELRFRKAGPKVIQTVGGR